VLNDDYESKFHLKNNLLSFSTKVFEFTIF